MNMLRWKMVGGRMGWFSGRELRTDATMAATAAAAAATHDEPSCSLDKVLQVAHHRPFHASGNADLCIQVCASARHV